MTENETPKANYDTTIAALQRAFKETVENANKYRRLASEYNDIASAQECAAQQLTATIQLLRSLQNGDAQIVLVNRAQPGN